MDSVLDKKSHIMVKRESMNYLTIIIVLIFVFILTLFMPYIEIGSTGVSVGIESLNGMVDQKPDNLDTANPATNSLVKYNKDPSENIEYHNSYTPKSDYGELPPGKMYFPNPDGTMKVVDIMAYDNSSHYYETSSYSTGPRNFIPIEETTTYASKLQGLNIRDKTDKSPIYLTGSSVVNTSAILGGFCTQYANNPDKLEELCRRIEPGKCATTTCCALLGGQRCVSANENGPIMKSNYSDYLIANRDYYYYQGKCYGICPTSSKHIT